MSVVFSTNLNLLYLLYLTARRRCLLPLKLHNISLTLKFVKKVITDRGISKTSGLDCIPVVVLKNCELELPYIQAELLNMCLAEPCFPDCWKILSFLPVFKNIGEMRIFMNVCLLVLVGKSSQEYPVNTVVPDGFILGLTLFVQYINNLHNDVICKTAIYIDDAAVYSTCDQGSDLCQQIYIFFPNWGSLQARLNNHYQAWSYKKKKYERLKHTRNPFRKNLQIKRVC